MWNVGSWKLEGEVEWGWGWWMVDGLSAGLADHTASLLSLSLCFLGTLLPCFIHFLILSYSYLVLLTWCRVLCVVCVVMRQ